MTERAGIYRLLRSSLIYDGFQHFIGRHSVALAHFVASMHLSPGDTVIDIGCGPGRVVPYLPESVRYIGFEPNGRYVETARSRYGLRGEFHVGYFDSDAAARLDNVDVAIVSAVLHHMSDPEARALYALLRPTLSKTGRVVSLDCVLHQGQHPVVDCSPSSIAASMCDRRTNTWQLPKALSPGSMDRCCSKRSRRIRIGS